MNEEKNKVVHCISSHNVRDIINTMREENVPNEDIVNLLAFGNQVYLVYYK